MAYGAVGKVALLIIRIEGVRSCSGIACSWQWWQLAILPAIVDDRRICLHRTFHCLALLSQSRRLWRWRRGRVVIVIVVVVLISPIVTSIIRGFCLRPFLRLLSVDVRLVRDVGCGLRAPEGLSAGNVSKWVSFPHMGELLSNAPGFSRAIVVNLRRLVAHSRGIYCCNHVCVGVAMEGPKGRLRELADDRRSGAGLR